MVNQIIFKLIKNLELLQCLEKISERDLQILTETEINSKNPVIWDNYTQMSGDKIIFTEDLDTNELDSIKIPNNVFIMKKIQLEIINTTKSRVLNFLEILLRIN